MKRVFAYIAAVASVMVPALGALPTAHAVTISNPITTAEGLTLGMPDPAVFKYGNGYVASGTTGALQPAMPIYYSTDLQHWTLKAYINPPASMLLPGGQVWADELHYYNGWWVAWYAIQLPSQQMVIAESWSPELFASNWQTKVILQNPSNRWTIDPSVQRDPTRPGILDMVYQMDGNIWAIGIQGHAPNFSTVGKPRLISRATLKWEYRWEEGPVLWTVQGKQYLLLNVGNTWDDTYAVAVEQVRGSVLTGKLTKRTTPVIQSDPRYPNLMGPGIGAQPFRGPGGEWLLAYHVNAPPNTYGLASRPLCFQRLLLGRNGPYVAGHHPWPTFQS